MSEIIISVIVPIYKVEAYLKRCIDSILSQRFKLFELILVDDGSPDKCPEICDEYALIDNRIKVIHKVNGGLADARNAGLKIARGEYIAFVDSDDAVHPCYLSCLYDAICSSHANVAVTKFLKFSSNEIPNISENDFHIRELSLVETVADYCSLNSDISATFISCCNKLYHRKLFESLEFPKGRLNEDAFVSYRLLEMAENKIVLVDVRLYYYFIREGSIVGSKFSVKNLDVLDAYHGAIEWFCDKNLRDVALMFYPPLLMREIYCWWGVKYVLKDAQKTQYVLQNYREDCKKLKDVVSISLKWKYVFKFFAMFPVMYALYRRFSPIKLGNR